MKIAFIEIEPQAGDDSASPDAQAMGIPGQKAGQVKSARQINDAIERCLGEDPDLIAIWDASLPRPDEESLELIASGPGDVWHGGLALGQGSLPRRLDAVHPVWMLGQDPPADIEASSWRLSLRACLLRPEVWRRLGGIDTGYHDLDAAALELGHRWLWGGALLRHRPDLIAGAGADPSADPASERGTKRRLHDADEARFLFQRTSTFWAFWALARGLISRRLSPMAIGVWWRSRGAPKAVRPHLRSLEPSPSTGRSKPSVTVLIPTLDRYPYLRVVLEQLETQTVAPVEVIVIDQTAPTKRKRDWHRGGSLNLHVIERDQPGQSSARNAGLRRAIGDVILFLDDDIEMASDLIERHLGILEAFGADASCGVAEEVGAGELPTEFRHFRLSDVFPTCNAALRREALYGSGLFDLAFDHGSRADADLGTRLYLSGALMVLAPAVSVLHHKAPAGGLREHKARVATYAASRRSLVRHLPSVTEIYLARRYGSPAAPREMLWQRIFGTLRARGTVGQRLQKLIWGLALLPDSLVRVFSRSRRAKAMLEAYPQIPPLPSRPEPGGENHSRADPS